MDRKQEISEVLKMQGLVPLYFNPEPEVSIAVLQALYNAGVRIVEYTNRGKQALENFKALKALSRNEMPGLYLGIGTIKNQDDAKHFSKAGADFLISPGFSDEVRQFTEKKDMLWIPGCMTVTEIMRAETLGVSLVKLFPGNVLGPGYVSAIRDLFPKMHFMPTGGVDTTEKNLREWFSSGVCAVGMGSRLITPEIMKDKNYREISHRAKLVLDLIQQIKSA